MKNLVYSIPIDTIEVLRNRVENAATTIRNNRGMLERVEESFCRPLHYCIVRLFILKVGVEESIVNALYGSRISYLNLTFLHEWCVHNRLFNDNFEDKFK
jgi:hypothetical protein